MTGVCVIEFPLCKWLPQTVFSLSCVPSSLHHPSFCRTSLLLTNTFVIYVKYRTHLSLPVFLKTTSSRQCHSGACTAAYFPALDLTLITLARSILLLEKRVPFHILNFYLDIQLRKTCKGASITSLKSGHSLANHFPRLSPRENVGSQW